MSIDIAIGDITQQRVDAIVNAANSSLLGGAGVDGAIHRVAGPELLEACRRIGGCDTGDAKITEGYRLWASHVIHTVGPIWQGGDADEPHLLGSCYRRSLELADANTLTSIAFPAISTGLYGYPIALATEVAVNTIAETLPRIRSVQHVTFVCFDARTAEVYEDVMAGR